MCIYLVYKGEGVHKAPAEPARVQGGLQRPRRAHKGPGESTRAAPKEITRAQGGWPTQAQGSSQGLRKAQLHHSFIVNSTEGSYLLHKGLLCN